MQKFKTTPKKDAHGTFVSATTGEIIYIDANHDDVRHNAPELTRAEADEAFQRGLIEDPAKANVIDESTLKEFVDPADIGSVAADRTAEFAKVDHEVSPQPSSLDSRQSTAWQDAERVQGSTEGFADGVRADDNADAAPAPTSGRRRRAPATPSET